MLIEIGKTDVPSVALDLPKLKRGRYYFDACNFGDLDKTREFMGLRAVSANDGVTYRDNTITVDTDVLLKGIHDRIAVRPIDLYVPDIEVNNIGLRLSDLRVARAWRYIASQIHAEFPSLMIAPYMSSMTTQEGADLDEVAAMKVGTDNKGKIIAARGFIDATQFVGAALYPTFRQKPGDVQATKEAIDAWFDTNTPLVMNACGAGQIPTIWTTLNDFYTPVEEDFNTDPKKGPYRIITNPLPQQITRYVSYRARMNGFLCRIDFMSQGERPDENPQVTYDRVWREPHEAAVEAF